MIQYEDFTQEDKETYAWILDALGKRDPRQATVIRSKGKSVYVRFHGEDPTNPEMKFPTLIAGVTPGTTGWMFWLPGGKAIFVPWGVPLPRPKSAGVYDPQSISAAGTLHWDDAMVTFDGLPPGREVIVEYSAQFRVTGGTGAGRFGCRVRNGATSVTTPGGKDVSDVPPSGKSFFYHAEGTATFVVGGTGVVDITPGVMWSSGAVGVNTVYVKASIH